MKTPVPNLFAGFIAIRCMVHSAFVFRNLKVFKERLPFTAVKPMASTLPRSSSNPAPIQP